ncbi:cobyrinate a,c-diamide synthase [Sulfurimonas sp. SAG-AH-194-I05]|nr:cobyrinate a,c-diamide synthase [Sulfurimonas sp. SAG-AH-194-I05]MDF1875310.1 cobyrinate a,c-diamide synthase [Sulfurimonas sp. SAG-AH-194-I05]
MKKALVVSAIASNQGKTLLTMALLTHFKNNVRPFKIGPDFIDPQFHAKVAATHSVNLDGYMMNQEQLEWMLHTYLDKDVGICEGVMGFYDGMDKGSSAYDVAKMLAIPTLLLLDAGGSYITIAAILKGMLEFRDDNTIQVVVLNKVSSQMHFDLVKKHIEFECKGVVVAGWIEKNLPSIASRHLGLDLEELEVQELSSIANDVLKHIDMRLLEIVMDIKVKKPLAYPFKKIVQEDEKCVLVYDKNFSFMYYDNIEYLKELYSELVFVDSTKDEVIPSDADVVVIGGGYVETDESYARIKDSKNFKTSLITHANANKHIYAECAGLIYLGKKIDDKAMSGILDIEFKLGEKRARLGYYKSVSYTSQKITKGHAFHYSYITSAPPAYAGLYKISQKNMKDGGYKKGNIYGTYLHSMWRV